MLKTGGQKMATWYLQTRNQRASAGRGRAHAMYIAGMGRYADKDEVIFVGDFNLPEWAEDAGVFFENADKHERANGRSFRSIVFAIPFEVSDMIGWSKSVAQDIVGDHAYRLAVHDKEGNPHAHIQMSERTNSPKLPPEKYFGRGNPKNRSMNGKGWLDAVKSLYERAIKRIVPNFSRPPAGGRFLKIGPKLKRAGEAYERARQERVRQNERIKQLEAEQVRIAEEIKAERRRDAEDLLSYIRPTPKPSKQPESTVIEKPLAEENTQGSNRRLKIR